VSADELQTPLGKRKNTSRWAALSRYRLPLSAGQLLALVCALFLATFLVYALLADNPLGGEPGVKIAIDPQLLPKPKAEPDAKHGAPDSAQAPNIVHGEKAAEAARGHGESPQKTITIIDGSSGERRDIRVPTGESGHKPAGDSHSGINEGGLFETSRYGEIPIISAAGIAPMQAYAQPADASPTAIATSPTIALVVTGLGLGAARTEQAIGALPRAVTLGFVPYGGELESLVAKARADGHEIVLQVPMEPFDYPDNDPGPQTLLTSASNEQNLDRLAWHMSRIKGYVGIANFMGARFMASEPGMRNVMNDLKKRGLIFLDDGTNLRSAAGQTAKADAVPFVRADIVIDGTSGASDIDKMLTSLEGMARQKGSAVGIASALPVSLERINVWSKTLQAKGVLLLPLSALMRKGVSG